MVESDSDNMRCLGCDYRLQGLPESVCPECGRAFDPCDVRTFAALPAAQRKARTYLLYASGLIVFFVGFAPRGLYVPRLTLSCRDCRVEEVTTRYELRPPGWIPFRYPGIYWPPWGNDYDHSNCRDDYFDVRMVFDPRMPSPGPAYRAMAGTQCSVNGIVAEPGAEVPIIESTVFWGRVSNISIRCHVPNRQKGSLPRGP